VYTIDYVYRHSPAEKAGLKAGDKIYKFHDAIVIFQNSLAFSNSIKDSPDTIQLIVTRQGKKMEFRLAKADKSTYLNRCVEGNCINGKGTFVTEEGYTYTGMFKNGKREGKGKTNIPCW
jgi:predicted metalloprotease with PDZ domain